LLKLQRKKVVIYKDVAVYYSTSLYLLNKLAVDIEVMRSEETRLKPGLYLQNKTYKIIELVKSGTGGFGSLYKIEASHKSLGERIVALKQLHYEADNEQTDNDVKNAFLTEAKTLQSLRIDSVPIVHDFFEEYDQLFLVIDYIEGETLENLIKNERLSLDKAIEIIEKLLKTVSTLHTYDPNVIPTVIHRDIKPANIILQGKKVWLVDFGIAKNSKYGTILAAVSSPFYSPPEQRKGFPTDERGDVYSIGATFYYILTRKEPTDSLIRDRDLSKKLPDPLKSINEVDKQIPEIVSDIVEKALAMDEDNRFATPSEMLDALREANRKINDVHEYIKKGEEYFEQGDWDKAIAEFEQVGKLKPDYSGHLFKLGYCHGENGDHHIAIQYYSELIKFHPKESGAFNNRAMSYAAINDVKNEITDLSRAVEISDKTLYRSNRIDTCFKIIAKDASFLLNNSEPESDTYKWAKRILNEVNEKGLIIKKPVIKKPVITGDILVTKDQIKAVKIIIVLLIVVITILAYPSC
jgi:serine/threonine protein kinase